jgi:hypothetical protein
MLEEVAGRGRGVKAVVTWTVSRNENVAISHGIG